jgi:hypothetical protein
MRLRQAQAILAAGAAVEALGLGFEMHPFDGDREGAIPEDGEYLTGFTEITDPDRPVNHPRTYHFDVHPGPGEFEISVHLSEGYGDDAPILLCQSFDVSSPDETGESFREGVAEEIAGLVGAAVRVYEVPFEAEYQERRELGFNRFTAERWNTLYEVGTPVVAYPLSREDEPLRTRTRTAAWTLGHGAAVVSVDGYAGGIALTHIDLACGGAS